MMKWFLGISLLTLCQAQEPAPALRGSTVDVTTTPALHDGSDYIDPIADLPYVLERQGRRHLQEGGMQPQSCNDNYSSCESWSSFVGRGDRHTTTITIPCGRCITMDHDGDTLTLAGLDIQGKLVFPNDYSGLTLYSSMIVVQGELEMSSSEIIGRDPAIKFVMTGNDDQYFEPIGENEDYCGGPFCKAGKKAIMVAGGRVDIRGLPRRDTESWVKLYDVSDSGQSTIGIVVPEGGVRGSWGVGAEILITSYTNKGDEEQVRRIASIDTDYNKDGFVRLLLNTPISRPTTTLDDEEHDFAVEVALLSRNIVFEGGDDGTRFHGGHFWIFETNGYNQHIEGVEIVNFGQAGNLGRYPLHAHMCGDLDGSVIARNTIRQSNQRCVVIHGSDNVLIEENVAYDTAGHCFMLEDGIETGNEFMRNLGARTKRPGRIIPNMGSNGDETDDDAATFWIPALGNTWVGNVAAGSTDNGWWFEPMLRGAMADSFDFKPKEVNIERFEGNVAHSNGIGTKTYPQKGLRPKGSPNRIVDFKVYRNQFKGLFVFFASNLIIQGGIFADNSVNLDIDNSVNVEVFDADIIGESDIYKQQIAAQRMRVPCLNDRVVGLYLHTDPQLHTDDEGQEGVTVHSASISGFSNTRCRGEFPARLDDNDLPLNEIPGIEGGGGGGGGDIPGTGGGGGGGGDHELQDLTSGLYINCGSETALVGGGITWQPDNYFENGEEVRMRPRKPSLYNQFREQDGDSLDYKIPVNDGNYKVTLYWAEYEFSSNNARKFDVEISGNPGPVLEDFDVHATAGGRRRLTKASFTATVTNDEELQIKLVGTTDNAFLSLLGIQALR